MVVLFPLQGHEMLLFDFQIRTIKHTNPAGACDVAVYHSHFLIYICSNNSAIPEPSEV
jgi:hypothetical protein